VTIAQESTRSLVPAGAWRVDPARSSITWELNGETVQVLVDAVLERA
jgi:hypothetical protein